MENGARQLKLTSGAGPSFGEEGDKEEGRDAGTWCEEDGILRENKCTRTGGRRCRRNYGAAAENGGRCPAKPKQGRPRTEFTVDSASPTQARHGLHGDAVFFTTTHVAKQLVLQHTSSLPVLS